jgi:nicotinamidase-related amidase
MRVNDYTEGNIDKKALAWLNRIRAAVAQRPHLRLDPSRAALLIIDMLHYFAHDEGRCFLSAAPAVVPRIRSLLERWRAMGRPAVFTRHCHEGEGDLGMLGRFFSDYIHKRSPESDIIDALAPKKGEPVVTKTTYDAFWQTGLASILERAGVDQLVITGVLTHMCCETTARAAFCRGYEVYLPVDAMASSRESLHLGALESMADCVGQVMSVEEVLARCG